MKPLHPFEDWEFSACEAGDLAPDRAAEVRAHAAVCGRCAGVLAEFGVLRLGLARLAAPEAPADAWSSVAASLGPRLAAIPGGHPFEDWQLSASLDGDLEPDVAVALESHLAQCHPCHARREELRSLTAGLAAMPAIQPSPFLWTRVQAGLWKLPERRPHRFPGGLPWVPGGLAAAAALAVILLGVPSLTHRPGVPPDSRQAGSAEVAFRNAGVEVSGTDASAPLASLTSSGSSVTGPVAGGNASPAAIDARPARPVSHTRFASVPQTPVAGPGDDDGSAQPVDPDPAVTAAIRAHLDELDAAINETQKNLAMNPGNSRVQSAAWAAYTAKVEYLRSILGRTVTSQKDRSSTTQSLAPGDSPA